MGGQTVCSQPCVEEENQCLFVVKLIFTHIYISDGLKSPEPIVFVFAGSAPSVHSRNAEVFHRPWEAWMGERELQANLVAGGHSLGQRTQRCPNRGAETEGNVDRIVITLRY